MKHPTETVSDRTAYERLCVTCDEDRRNTGRRLDGMRRWSKKRVAASVDQRMDGPERIAEVDDILRATCRRQRDKEAVLH